MTNRFKNAAYSLILILFVFAVWKYRQANAIEPIKIEGATMGTTYHIIYFDDEDRNFKVSIDSLLSVFNQSLSTYISNSEISIFNASKSVRFNLPYMLPVLKKSEEIVGQSNGYFDPTVMPLVNAWGFGPGKKLKADSSQIDSMMQFVGFTKLNFNKDSVWKKDDRVQLDFSAIAKGFGVDAVADFIKSRGISNLFVEIGGEVLAEGINKKLGKNWEIGILDPNSTYDNQFFIGYASLENKAMATSGNYFNYLEVDGQKYSHTIDPTTGYTVQNNLLSASVFAKDCMTADGWATAFMAMGYDKAVEKLAKLEEVDAFLIYSRDSSISTFVTKGISSSISLKGAK